MLLVSFGWAFALCSVLFLFILKQSTGTRFTLLHLSFRAFAYMVSRPCMVHAGFFSSFKG